MTKIKVDELFNLYCYLEPSKTAQLIADFKEQGIQFKVKQIGDLYRITVMVYASEATRISDMMEKYTKSSI